MNVFRAGMASILSHSDLSSTARIKAMVNWTGVWLALVQRDRSAARRSRAGSAHRSSSTAGPDPASCATEDPPGRLKDIIALIGRRSRSMPSRRRRSESPRRVGISPASSPVPAPGHSSRMLSSGKRHFTIGLDLLEALVLSQVSMVSRSCRSRAFIDHIALPSEVRHRSLGQTGRCPRRASSRVSTQACSRTTKTRSPLSSRRRAFSRLTPTLRVWSDPGIPDEREC